MTRRGRKPSPLPQVKHTFCPPLAKNEVVVLCVTIRDGAVADSWVERPDGTVEFWDKREGGE